MSLSVKFYVKYLFPLSLLYFACDKAVRRADVTFTEEDTQIEIGKDIEILYSDSALVRVRITAATLVNVNDRDLPRQEFPDGIQVDFFDQNLQIKSTLTAREAIRLNEKGEVIARDSVVLRTANGEKLETEELLWDEKTEQVSTDKFVKITKPGEVIYGYGLRANQDFTYWKITIPKGQIKAGNLDKATQ